MTHNVIDCMYMEHIDQQRKEIERLKSSIAALQLELEGNIDDYVSINKYSHNDYMSGICRGYEIAIAKMQLILNEGGHNE